MRHRASILSLAVVLATSTGAAAEKPADPQPTPRPANQDIVSPRDPASGLPTGKRMHKPLLMNEQAFELVGGRSFILDKTTGRVRFGDGVEGAGPPPGRVSDGTYRTGNGWTLVVKGGKLVSARDAGKMTVKISPEYTRGTTAMDAPPVATTPPPK